MKQDLRSVHIFQKENDKNCGPTCVAMVYKMYGREISVSDVLRDFGFGKRGKVTFISQLANHLLRNDVPTRLVVSNPYFLSPAWAGLPNKKLIENLDGWLKIHKKGVWIKEARFLGDYLKNGGEVEIDSFDTSYLKSLIDKGSILILCLSEAWLWGHRFKKGKAEVDEIGGKNSGHFVVAVDYKDGKFKVLDPYPTGLKGTQGIYWVDGIRLLNATLIWGSTILEVKELSKSDN